MEVNIIDKMEFGAGLPLPRLDAEYVWKSVWDAEKRIRTLKGWPLAQLVVKYDGPTLNDEYCDGGSLVNYIDIDSIGTSDGLAYVDELRYEDRPSRAKYQLEENDLLVSNVRPNRGAITLINSLRAGALASSGFSLLRDKHLKHAPQAYLFAFLKSRFGRLQLERRARGSMYPAVMIDDILDVWIPKPPERVLNSVCNAIDRGIALHKQFFELVQEQSKMLEDFLRPFGSPPSPLEGNLTRANWTEVSKLDSDKAQRFDAEFFRHEYGAFDARLQAAVQTFLLGEYYRLSPGRGLGKGNDSLPFIKQGALTNAGINWSAVSYESGALKSVSDVKAEDILLACTAHEIYYVGRKVDFVRSVPEEIRKTNAAVADLMVIRPRPEKPKHIHGSFVAAFLRSPAGLHQVQRCIRGLRGGHVYKDDLSAYVRVPVPEESWLHTFEKRAAAYESVRTDAMHAIAKGVQCVEDWIKSCNSTLT